MNASRNDTLRLIKVNYGTCWHFQWSRIWIYDKIIIVFIDVTSEWIYAVFLSLCLVDFYCDKISSRPLLHVALERWGKKCFPFEEHELWSESFFSSLSTAISFKSQKLNHNHHEWKHFSFSFEILLHIFLVFFSNSSSVCVG